MNLTDEQKIILDNCESNLFVAASPGSGKSTILSYIAEKLLRNKNNFIVLLTLSIVCPASIFANKRTDRLTGLLKKDIISIATIMGNKKIGTPDGANIFKKPTPFFIKPIIVTPTNITIARKNVIII